MSRSEVAFYDIQSITYGLKKEHESYPFADPGTLLRQSDLSVVRWRDNENNPLQNSRVINENYMAHLGLPSFVDQKYLELQVQQSLSKLYLEYSNRGITDRVPLEDFIAEDASSDRITHFGFLNNYGVLARSQLISSQRREDQLNVEKHFPEASELIRSHNDTLLSEDFIYHELGRLNIPKISSKTSPKKLSKIQKNILFLELFLRPFMYAIQISPNSKIVFQTNYSVLLLIKKLFHPYSELKTHKLVNSAGMTEFLTIIEPKELERITKILFYKRLLLLLKDYVENGSQELMITIHPEEKKYYDEAELSYFSQIWVEQTYAPVAKAIIQKNMQQSLMQMGLSGADINLKVELTLDSRTVANPHRLVIGQGPARALLQRLQSRLNEFGQN